MGWDKVSLFFLFSDKLIHYIQTKNEAFHIGSQNFPTSQLWDPIVNSERSIQTTNEAFHIGSLSDENDFIQRDGITLIQSIQSEAFHIGSLSDENDFIQRVGIKFQFFFVFRQINPLQNIIFKNFLFLILLNSFIRKILPTCIKLYRFHLQWLIILDFWWNE